MKIGRILNNELELLDIIEWGGHGGSQSSQEDKYLSSDELKKEVKEKLRERFSGLEAPTKPEIKLTVGQEFINWAEQYWKLKEHYTKSEENGSESCPYDYVKNIFIHKIDEIIKHRL